MGKKYDLPEVFEKKAFEYFRRCETKGKPLTFSGVLLHLNICRDTFSEYSKNFKFSDSCRKIKLKIENFLEEGALQNELNNNFVQFVLKNNFGWQEKTVLEQAQQEPKTLSREEVEKTLAEYYDKKAQAQESIDEGEQEAQF